MTEPSVSVNRFERRRQRNREALLEAAIELFQERGIRGTKLEDICERADVSARTFFNHFPDKREVLFAGVTAFEASIVKGLTEADTDLDPIDAAVVALSRSGLDLAQYRDFARARQDLIASSSELQERDLIKMASLVAAIAEALRQRQVPTRTATLTAHAAVAVFTTAHGDWIDDNTADLYTLMQQSLADLRQAVGSTPGTDPMPSSTVPVVSEKR